jgi:hypothetical protein
VRKTVIDVFDAASDLPKSAFHFSVRCEFRERGGGLPGVALWTLK